MKNIGILTSGGDCPGMNAVVRSFVRTCLYNGITPFGIEAGYRGLIDGHIRPLESKDASNLLQRGGTVLRSARCLEFKTKEGQRIALDNISKNNLDGIVVVGGDGSLTGAKVLFEDYNIPVIGIPGSIDNDIYGTDLAVGVDTALNTIVRSVDMLNDTASSHDRTFIVEVMGRHCGYLAITTAVTCGAEAVLIPEVPFNLDDIIKKIKKRYDEGRSRSVVIVAEGAGSAYDFGKAFELIGGFDTRITVLGHLQRGGSPTHYDRLLATRMGLSAVELLMEGTHGVMTGWQSGKIVPVPISEVLSNTKPLDKSLLRMAEIMSR
ncbi:6-phosphofructokinase [Deferribacterales bacterium RsTz2092]|nr:ATP-dependent 6-phosphofructokinase [Deferribacterales bacterium]